MKQPDPLSLVSIHLEMFFNGQPLKVNGSGFQILTRAGPMLVTAKHNLTGREPDGACKHSQVALPNLLKLRNHSGLLADQVPLYEGENDPNRDNPRFLTHSDSRADVALVPLDPGLARFAANRLHESLWRPESFERGIPEMFPGDECYVIGYPEGLTNNVGGESVLPVWKIGHIANDPQFKFNGQDFCLIDATTRNGVSGAPALIVRRGWDGSVAKCRFVGIYSGRTSTTSELGFVWRPTVIHEILVQRYGAV